MTAGTSPPIEGAGRVRLDHDDVEGIVTRSVACPAAAPLEKKD